MKTKLLIAVYFVLSIVTVGAQDTRLWATYYGGAVGDQGLDVITDASGNVYLTGKTKSSSGIASGGFQNIFGGADDAFLVKFDAAGNRLWATYYGGAGIDYGRSVATDSSGNVYLAGDAQSTSGIASGGFQNTFGGGTWDAFLVKFDAAGNRLWATYYGGAGSEEYIYGVTTDGFGNVYMTGRTTSTDSIASGGFQNIYAGATDAFLVKFDSSGNRLWATYYGGTGNDYGYNVSIDTFGNVYLAGTTYSASGIASSGFQNIIGGGADAFLVKFDPSGNRLWATYYGGTSADDTRGAATDASGNVYLTGWTLSTSGIASGGFQNTHSGGPWDGFLVKFNSVGNRLWATYYGGTVNDHGQSVATDALGNVYLTGYTSSTSNIASGGFQNTNSGFYDAYLVKFNTEGERMCATYYGGTGGLDNGYSAAVDVSGDVYMAGWTDSPDSIGYNGFQNTYGGGVDDAYLVKFTSFAPVSVIENENLLVTSIYPNPFSSSTTLQTDNHLHQAALTVYNCFGQTVAKIKNINGQTIAFNRDNLPSGLYFVRLTADNKVYTDKLVITDK